MTSVSSSTAPSSINTAKSTFGKENATLTNSMSAGAVMDEKAEYVSSNDHSSALANEVSGHISQHCCQFYEEMATF
jgi:hypothetical protein